MGVVAGVGAREARVRVDGAARSLRPAMFLVPALPGPPYPRSRLLTRTPREGEGGSPRPLRLRFRVLGAVQFEQFRERLRDAGLNERAAHYDDASFGSWYIEIEAKRSLRVVWDGKDGWLILQGKNVEGGWEDLWIAKTEAEQTPSAIVHHIGSLES